MEAVLQWGLDFIRAVQSAQSAPLTVIVKIITSLGGSAVYFALLPIFFWCIDEKNGLHLGVTVIISIWINLILKYLFDQPRPFFEGYDPSLGMLNESFGGLPSGHAQNSLVLYFLLASFLKKNWGYVCAGVLCLLIGFSRIYLGVHFPTDVLCGWLLGGVILCVYFLFAGKIERLLEKGGLRAKIITAALVSFIMILYQPDNNMIMLGGTFLGFCAGYCFNKRYIGFKSRDVLIKPGIYLFFTLFLRIIIGAAGIVLIFLLAGIIIPDDSVNQKLYEFLQAMLCGLWISFAAPWIFVRFSLAGVRLEQDVPD